MQPFLKAPSRTVYLVPASREVGQGFCGKLQVRKRTLADCRDDMMRPMVFPHGSPSTYLRRITRTYRRIPHPDEDLSPYSLLFFLPSESCVSYHTSSWDVKELHWLISISSLADLATPRVFRPFKWPLGCLSNRDTALFMLLCWLSIRKVLQILHIQAAAYPPFLMKAHASYFTMYPKTLPHSCSEAASKLSGLPAGDRPQDPMGNYLSS